MSPELFLHRVSTVCARLAGAFVVGVCLAGSAGAQSVGQEFIPLENWSYEAIERFEMLGMIKLPEDRPFNRLEFINIVTRISEVAFDHRLSPRDRYELDRLEKEFTQFASRRDPQARYDPPTLYLEDKPVLFTADFDLVGFGQRAPFDSVTTWYLQTNPDFQLHFGSHVTYDSRYRITLGPEREGREDGSKPTRRTRVFNGVTTLFERAYVIAAWDKFHFYFGREYVDWGPSDRGNLITPGRPYTLDQIGGRVRLKSLRLSFFNGTLSPTLNRHIAGHRLEIAFWKMVLGLNESVVYHWREMDILYFFPLSSFYANQYNERTNSDNILWSIDAKVVNLLGATLYTSLLIDDAQWERGEDDDPGADKFALDVGGRYATGGRIPLGIRARYRVVDIYTYTHLDSLSYYLSGDAVPGVDLLLGGRPGPDSDGWRVELEVFPRANVSTRAIVLGQRLGEGNDMRPWTTGEPTDPPFPLGVVQRTRVYGLDMRWEFDRNQWIRAAWAYSERFNVDHQPDVDDSGHSFLVEVRYEFL